MHDAVHTYVYFIQDSSYYFRSLLLFFLSIFLKNTHLLSIVKERRTEKKRLLLSRKNNVSINESNRKKIFLVPIMTIILNNIKGSVTLSRTLKQNKKKIGFTNITIFLTPLRTTFITPPFSYNLIKCNYIFCIRHLMHIKLYLF